MNYVDQTPQRNQVGQARPVSMRDAFGPGYQAAVVYNTHLGVAPVGWVRR